MAAVHNVSHNKISRNSRPSTLPVSPSPIVVPRCGVITLCGYGISVRIDRGHLVLEDGIGADRRTSRFPRIGHGIRRVVVVGSDGMVSLAALRWLADQGAAFVMLDRDGSVLATTGPVRPSDSKLRRAQALAHDSGAAVQIAKELIRQKLIGQEQVVRNRVHNVKTADTIARLVTVLDSVETINAIRQLNLKLPLHIGLRGLNCQSSFQKLICGGCQSTGVHFEVGIRRLLDRLASLPIPRMRC
jgi:hypothetical protein